MSKTPWTPGPWKVTPSRYVYSSPSDLDLIDANDQDVPGCIPYIQRALDEAEANANLRLIAAAPEMAEVLADLRRLCSGTPAVERNPRFVEINQRVLQLLARIRGDAP